MEAIAGAGVFFVTGVFPLLAYTFAEGKGKHAWKSMYLFGDRRKDRGKA